MTVIHPAGSGANPTVSKPFKAKTVKSTIKAPRQKSDPGEATSTQIPAPAKESPLWVFYALLKDNPDWHIAFGKLPCGCQDWGSKAANCVIAWRETPPAHRYWCECQIAMMGENEMREAIK